MTVTISGLGRRFQLAGVALVLVALAVALFARPASAAVTGSATPDTGLGDTGTISVTASGFAQDGTLHTVFVLECEHGATDSSQCDANTEDGSLNSNTLGNYSNPAYTYYTLPNAIFGGFSAITCDATHACDLVVIQDDYNNFSNAHVNIPITFTADAVTTSSPTTVPGTTTAPPVTTAPLGGATTAVRGTTAPTGGSTTAVSGTTAAGGTTTTVAGKNATTVAGQGGTVPTDPGVGGSDSGSGGSGGTLPFTGPPTAAPIIAICGLVIVLAGTVMRRVVLRVPDTGVPVS